MKTCNTILIRSALFCYILCGSLLTTGCSDTHEPDLSEEGTNDWIYKIMDSYYLWQEDLPAKETLNFSQSAENFFASLLSDQDGVNYRDSWLVFSSIEKKKETTKSIDESDSYGFQYATYSVNNGSLYYAWVLYVLPDSPAEEAGLKRGDWILAIGAEKPNVTNTDAFNSGAAAKFLIARFNGEGFVYDRTLDMPLSRAVEATPLLKDTIISHNGKQIGYLMYNHFISGPDNENEVYNDQLKELFVQFKSARVTEFVLDMRYNPGGLATCAQLLTSFLAPEAALGKTFCSMEYNSKHTAESKSLPLLSNAELMQSNLDLNRIFILTGATTASASEAVINGLIPFTGRENITLIGEKTIGKNVGSNTFGKNDSYDWILHPITFKIYNANGTADYSNGFTPDYVLNELDYKNNELLPLGDPDELLLKQALTLINGGTFRSLPAATQYTNKFDFPKIRRQKIQGFIY